MKQNSLDSVGVEVSGFSRNCELQKGKLNQTKNDDTGLKWAEFLFLHEVIEENGVYSGKANTAVSVRIPRCWQCQSLEVTAAVRKRRGPGCRPPWGLKMQRKKAASSPRFLSSQHDCEGYFHV